MAFFFFIGFERDVERRGLDPDVAAGPGRDEGDAGEIIGAGAAGEQDQGPATAERGGLDLVGPADIADHATAVAPQPGDPRRRDGQRGLGGRRSDADHRRRGRQGIRPPAPADQSGRRVQPSLRLVHVKHRVTQAAQRDLADRRVAGVLHLDLLGVERLLELGAIADRDGEVAVGLDQPHRQRVAVDDQAGRPSLDLREAKNERRIGCGVPLDGHDIVAGRRALSG